MTAPISLQISRIELMYLYYDDITGFCRTSTIFFTRNVLRSPTTGGKVFDISKKRQGKKISHIFPPNPSNAGTVYFVTCCKNIHSD